MKILLLDIETAPNLAFVWKLWDENVGLEQLVQSHYILCWAAKWLGEDKVIFSSRKEGKRKMLRKIRDLLNEADAVVHYNGVKFDIPHINRELFTNGFKPPAPYKQIDLLQTVKYKFKFASNKLQHVASELGIGEKVKHSGFSLWVGCIKNDEASWEEMQKYNIQDVLLLEKLYVILLPWIKNHANHNLYSGNVGHRVCPNCGSTHLHKRGFYNTLASTYQRFKCKDCGTWSRDNVILNRKAYKTVGIQS
jgi:uncharacterized protein YprB with RNaseH-like and TPR domain